MTTADELAAVRERADRAEAQVAAVAALVPGAWWTGEIHVDLIRDALTPPTRERAVSVRLSVVLA